VSPALEINALNAWYGATHILRDVSFNVPTGSVVTLLGRNGAGRSTTLRAILGMTSRRSGSVRIHGREIIQLPTYKIAHMGVGYCPEERGIFGSLTCEENLLLPPAVDQVAGGSMSLAEIYSLFPNLAARRDTPGNRLSGGEQQMLAIARILRTGAHLLLLDEISEGLAPVIVETLGRMLHELKARGYTILLAEQNFDFVEPVSDFFYLMEHGVITDCVAASGVQQNRHALERVMGV